MWGGEVCCCTCFGHPQDSSMCKCAGVDVCKGVEALIV